MGILTLMQPEAPPAPHPSPAEPIRAPLIASPGRAEEEVAALPIPPDTTDNELVALWLHGKSRNTTRAYSEDVAAFRAFTGKSLRATYFVRSAALRGQRLGAPATRARRLRALKSCLPDRWVDDGYRDDRPVARCGLAPEWPHDFHARGGRVLRHRDARG